MKITRVDIGIAMVVCPFIALAIIFMAILALEYPWGVFATIAFVAWIGVGFYLAKDGQA